MKYHHNIQFTYHKRHKWYSMLLSVTHSCKHFCWQAIVLFRIVIHPNRKRIHIHWRKKLVSLTYQLT